MQRPTENAFFIFGRKRFENADENEILFSVEKRKRAYITELSYGSVANITFLAQRK